MAAQAQGLVDKSEGLHEGSGRPRALPMKVRAWGAGPAQGPVAKSEGLGGQAGPGRKHCEVHQWLARL